MKMNRYSEAADAYRRLIALRGSAPTTQANYGEALLAAAQGEVTPPSREAFEAALKLDPREPKARFYMALAAEQDGDGAKARATYEELEPKATGPEPWMIGLRARLEAMRNPGAPAANGPSANFSPEQQKMIAGMVSGLADRLSKNGGSAEEWARLIRAYSVLKQPDKAKLALGDARKAYAGDTTALGSFDALARELGLGG
jgi:cytochrome c-type biogenesis protein CcmH